MQARQAYAEYLVRQKDVDGPTARTRNYSRTRKGSRTTTIGRIRFARFVGEADGQIGDRRAANNDRQGAADGYDAAAIAVERWLKAVKDGLRSVNLEGVVWLARLHRLAGLQYLELKKPDEAIARFGRALDARKLLEGNEAGAFDGIRDGAGLCEHVLDRTGARRCRRCQSGQGTMSQKHSIWSSAPRTRPPKSSKRRITSSARSSNGIIDDGSVRHGPLSVSCLDCVPGDGRRSRRRRISQLMVPPMRDVFRTAAFEFDLATGWWCELDGSEYVCSPPASRPMRRSRFSP